MDDSSQNKCNLTMEASRSSSLDIQAPNGDTLTDEQEGKNVHPNKSQVKST